MDPARRASRDRGSFARGIGHRTSTRKFNITPDHLCSAPEEVFVAVFAVVLVVVLADFAGPEVLQLALPVKEGMDFGGRKNKATDLYFASLTGVL